MTDPRPGPVGSWLLDDPVRTDAAADAVARGTTGSSPLVRRLNPGARSLLWQRVVAGAQEVLDDDLADVLLAGWRRHRTLRTAAQQTVQPPGSEQVVVLAEHQVTFERKAKVEIRQDGQVMLGVPVDVRVVFDVVEVSALVRVGRLMELRAGRSTITGKVDIAGQPLPDLRTRIPLTRLIRLGQRGFPLIEAPAAPGSRSGAR